MSEEFRFSRSGRQPRSVVLTALAVGVLLVAVFFLQIHPVMAGVFGILLLPAIWDVAKDRKSELTLTENALSWRMGGRGDAYDLREIERINTRLSWDFSHKARVLMKTGRKHRIPPPCVPQDGSLDAELEARGVAVEKSLF